MVSARHPPIRQSAPVIGNQDAVYGEGERHGSVTAPITRAAYSPIVPLIAVGIPAAMQMVIGDIGPCRNRENVDRDHYCTQT